MGNKEYIFKEIRLSMIVNLPVHLFNWFNNLKFNSLTNLTRLITFFIVTLSHTVSNICMYDLYLYCLIYCKTLNIYCSYWKEDQKFIKRIGRRNKFYILINENFSKNYKPIGVFVRKITDIYCWSRHFAEFIQTQKGYPTSFNKTSILILILLVISVSNFFCEHFSITYSLKNISYLSLRL